MDRILFYDGDCGICTRSVHFLMKRDPKHRLHFAPLQGETAASLLPEALRKELSTAVYRANPNHLYLRSDAILHALIDTGSAWRFAARIGLCCPRALRDALYNWVARNRDRRSPQAACPVPTAEQRQQLLP